MTARLADGAADRAAAAAMALGCPETAFEGLVAFAAADLLRARQAASKSDAATFGDAVAHARRGRDRLAALAGAAVAGPRPAAADLAKLAGRATAGAGTAAAAYYDELKHTSARLHAKVPDAAPADAHDAGQGDAPFQSRPPARSQKPADDDPLDAFDAAVEAARRGARRRRPRGARRASRGPSSSWPARERLDRRDAAAAACATTRPRGGALFSAIPARARPSARRGLWRSLQEASARAARRRRGTRSARACSGTTTAGPTTPLCRAGPRQRPPAPPAPPSWTRDATPCADALADRLDRLRAAPSAPPLITN